MDNLWKDGSGLLGPWEHFALLPCGPYTVPTVVLELRLITELFRNRPERSEPLIRFMQQNGCDVEFIRRGMVAGGLPQVVQDDVLKRLRESPQNLTRRTERQ